MIFFYMEGMRLQHGLFLRLLLTWLFLSLGGLCQKAVSLYILVMTKGIAAIHVKDII